ncbi:MAG: Ig-like domain-containing protein [Candidatus Cloacimonetes bacterium]|nr:Ig-like domain-containing protein [Candidatus Cloacimonadota bacterium]
MKRYLWVITVFCLILLPACGSKRKPTGGEQDLVKPAILSSSPAELGDISGKVIEIDFSKALDKASLPNAIYFYPPVKNKQISITRQTLKIEIKEDLQPDTFYYITLSNRLKDTRGNALERTETMVFKNGNPKAAKLSGIIDYEQKEDLGQPINFSLFSADSLLIMMREVSGTAYEIPTLEPGSFRARTYIDKNKNGRYDENLEAFFEESFELKQLGTLDLSMAYQDTSTAQIRQVKQHSPHELEIILSKKIASFENLNIQTKEQAEPLGIWHEALIGDRLQVLTAAMDSTDYRISLNKLQDAKGGVCPQSSLNFKPSIFEDKEAPRLLNSNPRNGGTVNTLKPNLQLMFSEIISAQNLHISLIETDSKKEIPIKIGAIQGRTITLIPQKELANHRSHTLIVTDKTQDSSGNRLESESRILFLPIFRR